MMPALSAPDIAEIEAARAGLKGIAAATPVLTSRVLNERTGASVYLKAEHLQNGGSFKIRGAYTKVHELVRRGSRGVVAFSSGNHAQGVALAARRLGVPAVIAMPDDAPRVKVLATQGYGAEVITYNRFREDRAEIMHRLASERSLDIVPPFDDPWVIAGQGSAALELLEVTGPIDDLVVPVGGGGLISGCAIATHATYPQVRLVGVEPVTGNDAQLSLQAGYVVSIPSPETIADAMRGQSVGQLTFQVMQRHIAQIGLVSDEEIVSAMRFLALYLKQITEPTAAAAVALLLSGRLDVGGRRVAVILSGGNVDPTTLRMVFTDGTPTIPQRRHAVKPRADKTKGAAE